jgi:HK97 family phage major capsid protein
MFLAGLRACWQSDRHQYLDADVAPGATPVAFADWQRAYTVVNRRATTMLTDPFSAGFCTLFRFEARVGGSPTCPNAARLLRIR